MTTSPADVIFLNTSSDGGLTWGPNKQPARRPDWPWRSPDGAAERNCHCSQQRRHSPLRFWLTPRAMAANTWSSTVTIAVPNTHGNSGGLRDLICPMPRLMLPAKFLSCGMTASFRAGALRTISCSARRPTASAGRKRFVFQLIRRPATVDHFIPGIEIEPGTSGATAHIGLTYYFYPVSNCTVSSCQLMEGYVSSPDGGTTWTAPITLAGPISIGSLPQTSLGPMVGDYQSLSFAGGTAHPVFAVANPRNGAEI